MQVIYLVLPKYGVINQKSYIIGTRSNGATEVMLCLGGADGTKSDGGIAYRFLITILR